MLVAVIFSILAGAFGVWQAGMNKVVADSLGFSSSVLLNGFFLFFFNLLFFILVVLKPKTFPAEFSVQWNFQEFKLWWIVPGLMGFVLVLGLAVSVGRIGAVRTFVIAIAAQIFASMLWDFWAGDQELNKLRLVGAFITLCGAVLATIS